MATTPANYKASIPGRDELELHIDAGGVHLKAIGCPELLRLCSEWRPQLKGEPKAWPLPGGDGHAAILLREVILKARGEWEFPYQDEELCHCRAVPTAKVDAAVVTGAHTVPAVSRRTSAGTSCGTCQPDIKKVIAYRTKSA